MDSPLTAVVALQGQLFPCLQMVQTSNGGGEGASARSSESASGSPLLYCTHDSLSSLHNTVTGWQREVTPEESCVDRAGLQEGAGTVALLCQRCHFPRL
jgi:hypothetical protein